MYTSDHTDGISVTILFFPFLTRVPLVFGYGISHFFFILSDYIRRGCLPSTHRIHEHREEETIEHWEDQMLVTDRFSSPYFPPSFFFFLLCVCVFFFYRISFLPLLPFPSRIRPTPVNTGRDRQEKIHTHTHEKKRSTHFIPFSILQFPVLCAPISSGRPAKCLQIFDRIGWGVRPPHSHNRREIDKKKINKTDSLPKWPQNAIVQTVRGNADQLGGLYLHIPLSFICSFSCVTKRRGREVFHYFLDGRF